MDAEVHKLLMVKALHSWEHTIPSIYLAYSVCTNTELLDIADVSVLVSCSSAINNKQLCTVTDYLYVIYSVQWRLKTLPDIMMAL